MTTESQTTPRRTVTGFELDRGEPRLTYRHDLDLRSELTAEQGAGSSGLVLFGIDLDGTSNVHLVCVDLDAPGGGRQDDVQVLDRVIAAATAARQALTA